jgi:dipeptidyl aminopeptidase/acylaminoacyl peptidase
MKQKLIAAFATVFLAKFGFCQGKGESFATAGQIIITTPFYKQSNFYKWYYDRAYYEKARTTKQYNCLKILYKSDTATVEAWLYKPATVTGKKLPLIIYNRGGMGNFGNLEETNLVDFFKPAENGYAVLATKTRFAGVNGKYDQHGGVDVDVDDIVNLKNIYENLPWIDTANIFMYGFSIGGQNTYQASLKMKLNAIVVIAGTADWISRTNERREFVDGWTDEDSSMNYLGFAKVFPNWNRDSMQILKDRSAIYWADMINTPVLSLNSR